MEIPRIARYDYATNKAYSFISENAIVEFPIDPIKIAEYMDIPLMTYSKLAKDSGVSVEKIIEQFGTKDGISMYYDGYFTIAYNDSPDVKNRLNFTILHELGHIYLNHHIDFERTTLLRSAMTKKEYAVLENEANCFARNVLSPAPVVSELRFYSPDFISEVFNISFSAAKTRLKLLANDIYHSNIEKLNNVRRRFNDFVTRLKNTHQCLKCHARFFAEEPTYCPICSSKRIYKPFTLRGVDDSMIYTGHKVDKHGRAMECPRCGNEDLNYDGEYCKICGGYIVNKCADTYRTDDTGFNYMNNSCGQILDGNARYCHKCGNESTFYQQEFLIGWEVVQVNRQKEIDNLIYGSGVLTQDGNEF